MRRAFIKRSLKVFGLLGFIVSTQTAMSCAYGCPSDDCDDGTYYTDSSSDGSLEQSSSSAPAQTGPLKILKVRR